MSTYIQVYNSFQIFKKKVPNEKTDAIKYSKYIFHINIPTENFEIFILQDNEIFREKIQ